MATASSLAIPSQHRRLFRWVALVILPLMALVVVEGSLRLLGYGYPTTFFIHSNFVGRQVLIENEQYGWRFFGPELARAPRPVALSAVKPKGTYRIFMFGESAAYGDPLPDFGLPRMLEVLLRERWPGVRFEVVNAAMTAINSHVVLPIARDCAQENGDLWVIYMGNNEVVGPYGGGTIFSRQVPPLALIRARMALGQTRIGQWLTDLAEHWPGGQRRPTEWRGMKMFLQHQVGQDDPRMAAVYAHFARNLTDMLALGRDSGVKIVVSTVLGNLRDCAPFASLHRPGLTPAQVAEWTRFYQLGVEAQKAGKPGEAIAAFEQAGRIDPQFAALRFRWGHCCLALGKDEEARQHFRLARDSDALRFRVDSRINELIRQTARQREQEEIYLLDTEEWLARRSPHGLLGEELLYEHVHLNFDGNYLLARAVAEQVGRLLPDTLKRSDVQRGWLSASECAQRLAWTDWNRYEAAQSLVQRLNEPPFTDQFDHAERQRRAHQKMERLWPALSPAALREAVADYRRAIAHAPEDWVLHNNLARLLQKLGDLSGTVESCREVIRLLPHSREPRTQLGLLLTQQGRYEEATRQFDAVLSRKPIFVPAINGRGLALARQGQYEAAIREYERALRIEPDDGETHLNLGMALSAQGKANEAKQHFRQALGRRLLKPDALVALGKMCFGQGWANEAITNFTDALRLEPNHATAHFCLGGVLASVGQRVEAQRHYAEAVRLEPELAEAHLGLGIEFGRQGQDAQAMEQFAEAARLKPDLIEARVNLGIALNRQQRFAEALHQFQEALRLDPTNAVARKYTQTLQGRRSGVP